MQAVAFNARWVHYIINREVLATKGMPHTLMNIVYNTVLVKRGP